VPPIGQNGNSVLSASMEEIYSIKRCHHQLKLKQVQASKPA
jgi:hypothetical protein